MITKEVVAKVFQRWVLAGLPCPAYTGTQKLQLLDEFIERFSFMDEDTLEFVAERMTNSVVWPSFAVIKQTAQQYMESTRKYNYIDYLAERKQDAYADQETFDQFIHRVAKKFFPSWSEEWIKKNQFALQFYGIAVHGCDHCDGHCLHHGHRYHLRIRKGTGQAVPYADLDLCKYYKDQSTKTKRNTLPPEEPEFMNPDINADPGRTKATKQQKTVMQEQYKQLSAFEEQMSEGENYAS